MLRRRLSTYLLIALALYWASMFVATHIPGDKMPEQTLGFDKVFHFAAYAALAWLAALLSWVVGWWNWKSATAIVIAAALYGAVDEWLQPYFHRSAELHDWLADVAGAVFGLLAFYVSQTLWRRWYAKREQAIAPRPPAAS